MSFSSARAWSAWHEAELAWFDTHEARIHAQLRSDRNGDVAAALQVVARRRLSRERLTETVLPSLGHEQAPIRGLTCVVLGKLGSSRALPDLVDMLGDPDDGVSAAAHGALQAITERDFEADPERISANIEDGMLKVRLSEHQAAKPRQIEVN